MDSTSYRGPDDLIEVCELIPNDDKWNRLNAIFWPKDNEYTYLPGILAFSQGKPLVELDFDLLYTYPLAELDPLAKELAICTHEKPVIWPTIFIGEYEPELIQNARRALLNTDSPLLKTYNLSSLSIRSGSHDKPSMRIVSVSNYASPNSMKGVSIGHYPENIVEADVEYFQGIITAFDKEFKRLEKT